MIFHLSTGFGWIRGFWRRPFVARGSNCKNQVKLLRETRAEHIKNMQNNSVQVFLKPEMLQISTSQLLLSKDAAVWVPG
jgi:hypothetical protein